MHKHVFIVAKDGEFKSCKTKYDCKCLPREYVQDYLDDGWSLSLGEAIKQSKKPAGVNNDDGNDE